MINIYEIIIFRGFLIFFSCNAHSGKEPMLQTLTEVEEDDESDPPPHLAAAGPPKRTFFEILNFLKLFWNQIWAVFVRFFKLGNRIVMKT